MRPSGVESSAPPLPIRSRAHLPPPSLLSRVSAVASPPSMNLTLALAFAGWGAGRSISSPPLLPRRPRRPEILGVEAAAAETASRSRCRRGSLLAARRRRMMRRRGAVESSEQLVDSFTHRSVVWNAAASGTSRRILSATRTPLRLRTVARSRPRPSPPPCSPAPALSPPTPCSPGRMATAPTTSWTTAMTPSRPTSSSASLSTPASTASAPR
ncbi:Os02g0223200 [Oryza sativa Japonica Group]|uniref:Os02g0223200 protein n=2 Tax=Oryza sativa subsp. japonica TaxID=39947 RepID=Q6YVF6_ORYSJ|nr:unknown protein [Oryza sativa Japonica Group]BAS77715.1 Os02g0223200 [Oryza sativa Japonica Group]